MTPITRILMLSSFFMAARGEQNGCPVNVDAARGAQGTVLAQLRSKRLFKTAGQPTSSEVQSPVSASYLAWETAQVIDTPFTAVQTRSQPACTVSDLTHGCLPNFMVIGTQKSGTSSLYNILKSHPQIKTAKRKELLWFMRNMGGEPRCNPPEVAPRDHDFKKYLSMFPVLQANTTQLLGEFSATYMHCWCCPASMRRLMPGLRLVTQLRDPIDRARSRWTEQHTWKKLIKTYGSFEEYIERELPVLESCLLEAEGSLVDEVKCATSSNVLGLSLYDSAIKLWLNHTDYRDFLVTYMEQLKTHPQSIASAINNHLGIEDIEYPDDLLHQRYNAKGNYGWSLPALPLLQVPSANTALQRLYKFYRPHVVELKTLADAGLISPLPPSWVTRWGL